MPSTYSRLSRTQLISLLAISIPAIILLDLSEDVWFLEDFWWDERFALALHSLANPLLTWVVRFVTFTGGYGAYPIYVLLTLWWLSQGKKQRAWILSICFLGSGILNMLLKSLFVRPRPLLFEPLVTVGGYSFPSGHSIAGITLYGIWAIFLWQERRQGLAVATAIWGMLIGLSRVYLGVHYPSDVLAAWMAGILWIVATFTVVGWVELKVEGETKDGERTEGTEQDQLVSHSN